MRGKPIWEKLAHAGLARVAQEERLNFESIKSSIELRFMASARMASRPVDHISDRPLSVTLLALGRGRNLRIFFELTEPVTIWAIALTQPDLRE